MNGTTTPSPARGVNLIPAARLGARRRRAHRRRCVAGCSAYAAAALVAGLACRAVWGRSDASLPARLADAQAAVDRVSKDVASARADLDAAQATLRASRSIAEQPDWSTLMKLLAAREGDEVVLRECRVQPRGPEAALPEAPARPREPGKPAGKAAAVPAAPPEPSLVLSVAGLGRSQPAVSQFVLRLEALRLFARVSLLDTSRETYLGGEAVGFRVECSLDDPGVADPAAAGAPGNVALTTGGAAR